MNDLPALPVIRTGKYRHYKGGEYEVIGVARHSETLEPMVIYRALYGEGASGRAPPRCGTTSSKKTARRSRVSPISGSKTF